MKRLRILSIFLLSALLLTLFAPGAAALDEPQADSSYAVVLLAERGSSETVLYTKNAYERLYPASLTKVMTVLLAVEAVEAGTVKLSDPVTAQPDLYFDISGNSSSVYMSAGETMSLENLLYCAMVESANEACNVIAEYIGQMAYGGSVSEFVEAMNARAAELGCTDTHFVNTHGMPDPDHYTTAWDFSRILREAVGHELIMEISNTITYTVPDTNNSAERRLENTNSLINPTNRYYPGPYGYDYARGVKTGHTDDAGYCLATTAEKDGVTLLCVIMNAQAYELEDGSTLYGHFTDARTLFDWAFDNFSYQEIVKSTEIVTEMPVIMGADADSIAIRPSMSITAFLPNDVDLASFERTVTLYPTGGETEGSLTAPVSAGQTVGEISVSLNGEVYGTSPLVTSTSVELSRVQFMKGQLMETLRRPAVIITFWSLMLLFMTYLALVIRYRMKRRAYQRRLEAARQIRLDLEDEEERRYERRPASPRPKQELSMEPEKLREDQGTKPMAGTAEEPPRAPDKPQDSPTRPLAAPEEPGEPDEPDQPDEDGPGVRDYFEEFFSEK